MYVLASFLHLEIIILRDVGDADDEDAHLPTRTVHHAGRDMDEGSLEDRLFNTIKQNDASSFEDIVEFGGALMVVELCSVDVHRMRPGRRRQAHIFATDQTLPPATGAALTQCVAFVADQQRT